jgi:peptidoglycan/xylan/chitin deacetylase (PgdA/CDA1 family)
MKALTYNIPALAGEEKKHLRKFVFRLLLNTGILRLWHFFVQRKMVAIVCYHDPDLGAFSRHLKAARKYFNIISLREYANARINRTVHQLPENALVITIDDGHAGNFELLQVIAEERVPVTIFLTTGVVGTQRHFWWTAVQSENELRRLKNARCADRIREMLSSGFEQEAEKASRQALSTGEIRAMAPYVDFQSHTRFHPVLPMCTSDQAMEEIHGSRRDLSEGYSFDIYALSYPYGYYSERDIELTKQAGFLCAVTVDEGLNNERENLFRLKRIAMPDDADEDEFIIKASGLWAALGPLFGKRPEHGYKVSYER